MNVELLIKMLTQIASAFLGSFGFSLLFNLTGKRLMWASIGGSFAWTVYLIVDLATGNLFICGIVSAIVATIYSEVFARILKTPKTAFIFPAIIPMVPGGSLYYTMSNIIMGNTDKALEHAKNTLGMAVALAFGIVIVIIGVKATKHIKKKNIT